MTDRITRRELLRRGAVGGAALTFPSILAACGGDDGIQGQAQEKTTTKPTDTTLAKTLTISNWPLYIDVDEKTKKRPTIEQFERKYGVKVKYIEDVNDNNEFFAKIQPQLSNGQAIGRDLIVLTDWMAARLVRLGWLEKLNKDAMPNFDNLVDALASPAWDPNRDYSLPWQSGMTGIGYNRKALGRDITSVEELFTAPDLKGKVIVLTEMGDTVGLTMLANGDDPAKVTDAAFTRAIKRLKKALDSGQIRQFSGNEYSAPLARGDALGGYFWSGDIIQLQFDNPSLKWTVPDSGGMIWSDNMLIPKGGDVFTASTFMNFVYGPRVQAQIEAYVNYIPPVKGTRKELVRIDKSLAKNNLIFPTQATLSKVHQFDPKAYENEDYRRQFEQLLGA
ncbi:MAG: spermidine/putrescine ABC transporter substrate-binding protein [Actinomycetota bacterium]|nr:spermidine/putrescine ABC transporter substrate-binding protein [Actinomycetota bacterium]